MRIKSIPPVNAKTGQEKGAWSTWKVVGGNSKYGSRGFPDRSRPTIGSPTRSPGVMTSLARILSGVDIGA